MSDRLGFRFWLGGATASTLGDSVTFFALTWVAASRGPGVASLVLTAESIPLCLFILLGGALADRWGIRQVMIGCDGFMAGVMVCIAVGTLVAESVPLWALLVVAVLGGTAASLRRPAAGVFPRMFATGDDLSRAMATTTVFEQLAQIAGRPVGGALLAAGGLALTSAVDAGTFLVVLGVLLVVRPPLEPTATPDTGQSVSRLLHEAISSARHTPGAVATILTVVGLAVTILPLVSLCVPLLGHDRGWGPGGTGLVSAAWVVGGLFVMAWVARRGMPGPRVALAGPVIAAVGALLLAASMSQTVGAVALTLVGVGTSLLTTRLFPRFFDATPPHMLARFSSLLGLAQTGPLLVVTPVLGALIGALGMKVMLGALAAALILTLVAAHEAETQPQEPITASTISSASS
jgi:MFS family permease